MEYDLLGQDVWKEAIADGSYAWGKECAFGSKARCIVPEEFDNDELHGIYTAGWHKGYNGGTE